MYGLQLSIQPSNIDILQPEPKAARDTWKYHLTKSWALVYVLGQEGASGWKILKKEHTPFSLPGLTKIFYLTQTLNRNTVQTACLHTIYQQQPFTQVLF